MISAENIKECFFFPPLYRLDLNSLLVITAKLLFENAQALSTKYCFHNLEMLHIWLNEGVESTPKLWSRLRESSANRTELTIPLTWSVSGRAISRQGTQHKFRMHCIFVRITPESIQKASPFVTTHTWTGTAEGRPCS